MPGEVTATGSSYATAVEEAAYAGLESMRRLIVLLSQQQENKKAEMDEHCRAVADAALTKFRKVIALLGRTTTGHARFRSAPLPLHKRHDGEVERSEEHEPVKPIERLPPLPPPHHRYEHFSNSNYASSPSCSIKRKCERSCHSSKKG
ncbi:putative WRKY transcription factor 7 [Cocos nucifera]|uniref:Putative WRKY transcription factor 7 n=1 Tax=Cocos nucifera TaxID=13894 RepID=A0A8K0INI5_COCNU|nr:putative WRKY transcription factor 7 [Cocos nucifera]